MAVAGVAVAGVVVAGVVGAGGVVVWVMRAACHTKCTRTRASGDDGGVHSTARASIALPWDAEIADPVGAIASARAELGDTFVVASGGVDHLFVFSPAGVRSFYALDERLASKGIADWKLMARKLPDEMFAGRRTLPHDLFGRRAGAAYLGHLAAAIAVEFDALGDAGTVDVFDLTRRLGHRMGLASWGGQAPEPGERFEELVRALDVLDGADAFVRPEAMAAIAANGKRNERAALARLEAMLAETVRARDGASPRSDLFADIVGRWHDVAEPERSVGIARDVVLVHIGSMSNLFAALGWTIVDLLRHPAVFARLRDGETELAERCALESTRLAQRSIMLRWVVRPVEVELETRRVRCDPGTMIATLLPLTNGSAAPGLDRYDPDRWDRRRLRDGDQLAARELVTTFGHGAHTCPAQPFSLAAITAATVAFISTFDLERQFTVAEPRVGQIGGVARSAEPCEVGYRRR